MTELRVISKNLNCLLNEIEPLDPLTLLLSKEDKNDVARIFEYIRQVSQCSEFDEKAAGSETTLLRCEFILSKEQSKKQLHEIVRQLGQIAKAYLEERELRNQESVSELLGVIKTLENDIVLYDSDLKSTINVLKNIERAKFIADKRFYYCIVLVL